MRSKGNYFEDEDGALARGRITYFFFLFRAKILSGHTLSLSLPLTFLQRSPQSLFPTSLLLLCFPSSLYLPDILFVFLSPSPHSLPPLFLFSPYLPSPPPTGIISFVFLPLLPPYTQTPPLSRPLQLLSFSPLPPFLLLLPSASSRCGHDNIKRSGSEHFTKIIPQISYNGKVLILFM